MKQTAGKAKKQRKKWRVIHPTGNTCLVAPDGETLVALDTTECGYMISNAGIARRIARLLNEDDARKAKKRGAK